MSQRAPLLTTEAGIRHHVHFEADGTMVTSAIQELDPILDRNRAMATENDGYSPSRELRRVASIPWWLIFKWRHEEGFDALNPHHADRLARKLNDPDYAWLRTAPGQLAMTSDGRGFR